MNNNNINANGTNKLMYAVWPHNVLDWELKEMLLIFQGLTICIWHNIDDSYRNIHRSRDRYVFCLAPDTLPVNLANEGHVIACLQCSTYCLERGNWLGGGGVRRMGNCPMTATQRVRQNCGNKLRISHRIPFQASVKSGRRSMLKKVVHGPLVRRMSVGSTYFC